MGHWVPLRQIMPSAGKIQFPCTFSKPPSISRDIIVTDMEGVRKIISLVCERFGVAHGVLACRRLEHVEVRHILIYLLYKDTPLTGKNIALLVGLTNHTSILNAVKKMTQRLEEDPDFQMELNILRSRY